MTNRQCPTIVYRGLQLIEKEGGRMGAMGAKLWWGAAAFWQTGAFAFVCFQARFGSKRRRSVGRRHVRR